MKHVFTLVLSVLALSLFGQISISKFSLPDVGATLKTYTTINSDINLGNVDGPQEWDFTSLAKDNYSETKLEDPVLGSVILAEATFLIKSNDVVEQYYNKSDSGIEEIYIKTLDPVFGEFEISNSYGMNPVYRKADIIYGESYESESRFEAPLAWSDLPDTITSEIGLAPDSIRFTTVTTRQDEIDAYGVVKLPDGDWDALREYSLTERKVIIEIFFFGAWIEAPQELLDLFLGDFATFLEPDTTYSYNFYTDKAIEVLASVQLDGDGNPLAVEYKAGAEITEVFNPDLDKKPTITAYPNPTFADVSFNFQNCRPGTYNIEIYDILGKSIWKSDYLLNSKSKPLKTDVSHLRKGTYLFTIHDSKGNKITTKRLVVMNP